jgi:putative transposase
MDHWSKWLKGSEEYGFLKEAPSQVLQQKLRDLDKAYRDGFDKSQRGKRLPKRRRKELHNSFRYPDAKQFRVENRRVYMPKLGWVGFFKSQAVKGEAKNLTVSYQGGKWYMSLQVEEEISLASAPVGSEAGIDLGIAKLATVATSNGGVKVYAPLNSYKKNQEKLSSLQKELSRRVKGSKNWSKSKGKVQRLHGKIRDIRKDYLHKISHELSESQARVFVEDLQVSNMMSSAKGTLESPGKNVRAKAGLNRSIGDQGWYELRRQLSYKLAWRGGKLEALPAQYTSQRCSNCGYISKSSRRSQSDFECVKCGYRLNADANASRNILAAGQAVVVCESNSTGSRKQKLVRSVS